LSPATRWYLDGDGDGYGLVSASIQQCTLKDGYVASSSDCNDDDSTVYPGATELCDGQYNNCSDAGYDADGAPADETDNDVDGYVECTVDEGGWDGAVAKLGGDCDDTDGTTSPATTWYRDSDGDGYGDSATTRVQCATSAGYIRTGGDCNDGDASVYPSAVEICDGIYNNCSDASYNALGAPADETDNDTDGYVECTIDTTGWDGADGLLGGDCDDTNASLSPATVWHLDVAL